MREGKEFSQTSVEVGESATRGQTACPKEDTFSDSFGEELGGKLKEPTHQDGSSACPEPHSFLQSLLSPEPPPPSTSPENKSPRGGREADLRKTF